MKTRLLGEGFWLLFAGAFAFAALASGGCGSDIAEGRDRPPTAAITDSQQRLLFAGGGRTVAFEYRLTSDASGTATTAHLEIVETGAANQLGRVLARTEKVPVDTGQILLWNGLTSEGNVVDEGEYLAYVVTEDAAGNRAASRPTAVVVYQPIPVNGVVVDEAGQRVSGVEVSVIDTDLSSTTEADGSFHLASCPMGFPTFEAAKAGVGSGSVRVKLNSSTGTVAVVLGQTAGGTAADGRVASAVNASAAAASSNSTVRIQGQVWYQNQQGVAQPMKGARVVLQDDATHCWVDLLACTSTAEGVFAFEYDYNEIWDASGEPDVRVVAYAQDRDADICGVYDGFLSYMLAQPYMFVATPTWNDNKSSRVNLTCVKSGDDRVAWFIYESALQAHDTWQALTGYDREWVWIDYPAEVEEGESGQFMIDLRYTCINMVDNAADDAWRAATTYHEYGHSVHYALSQVGAGCNAYAAYCSNGWGFWGLDGKWVGAKDNTGTYDRPAGAWKALKEGFAEFFAALISDWDLGAMGGTGPSAPTLERNVDVGLGTSDDADDTRIARSVARALWDMYDRTGTPLCCNWEVASDLVTPVPAYHIARPVGPLGDTDDDLLSNSGAETASFGGTLAKLVTVLQNDYPADMHELYHGLTDRYPTTELDHTALQAILYSNGILKDHAVEWLPEIRDAVITPAPSNGAYRGTVTVYVQVEDANGSRDLDRASVRLEMDPFGNKDWSPLGWTYTRLQSAPPGKSGDNWYAIRWDTRVPSPCTIRFRDPQGYEAHVARVDTAIAGRKEGVKLRAIANDRFGDSKPADLQPITVDNGPGAFGDQAEADARSDYIAWAGMDSITNTPYTYELFFTPSVLQAGVIAEYTLGYAAPVDCRAPIMRLELTDDGRVLFSVNKNSGSGPGGGTWCYPYEPQNPTRLEVGRRYHIAADNGPAGLSLYIDGRLEAAAPYFDYPQPDWSDGTLYGGWFSIGDYETLSNTDATALGRYDEVRVSKVQRYTGDAANPFTPPSAPFTSDADTMLLDHLDGSTTGDNNGMTFGP